MIVEQFGIAQVAFEELVAHGGAVGQLQKRAVTGFVTEDEPLGMVFPEDDNGLLGVHVGVRRTGGERARVVTGSIVVHLQGGDSRRGSLGQLGHGDGLRLLEDRIGAVVRFRCGGSTEIPARHNQHRQQSDTFRRFSHAFLLFKEWMTGSGCWSRKAWACSAVKTPSVVPMAVVADAPSAAA